MRRCVLVLQPSSDVIVVQTQKGGAPGGLCKEEFQDFMKYFVHPLLVKDVQDRLKQEEAAGGSKLHKVSDKPLAEVVDVWRRKFHGAYLGFLRGAWVADKKHKPTLEAFKFECDATPYLLTLDNARVYSFLGPVNQLHTLHLDMSFPFSLLQIFHIPPHGHDIHQIVEHAIGVIKNHVRKWLDALQENVTDIQHEQVFEQMLVGAKAFTNDSWRRNVHRLFQCLKIVAAERDEMVPITKLQLKGGVYSEVPTGKQRKGLAGSYCYLQLS